MLLIGLGISLPWGLMDGLAISVVPKERAGMATGIFSTTRVAGEGVALAVVGAVLSALTAGRLAVGDQAGAAAQRLVTGDLAGAARTLGTTDLAMLAQGYGHAFSTLATILCAVTVVTALFVFVFLCRSEEPTSQPEGATVDRLCSEAGASR